MKKRNDLQKGFSILEVVVMIGILGLIGVIATGVFFTTLRSSTRSRVSENLKQKGDFALNVIEKMVRGASFLPDLSANCDGSDKSSISVVSRDGFTTTFDCSSDRIASVSAQQETVVLLGDITRIDCDRFVSCVIGSGGSPEVIIDFTLYQGGDPELPYEKSSINFHTQVTPRNY
ncbi:MAG: hypothetical protein ABH867_03200 [Patescibacteria group bacterium]|nr:hypothetical protein [Patescibacteria group bacterium]